MSTNIILQRSNGQRRVMWPYTYILLLRNTINSERRSKVETIEKLENETIRSLSSFCLRRIEIDFVSALHLTNSKTGKYAFDMNL